MVKKWLFGDKRRDDAQALSVLKAQINKLERNIRNYERLSDEQKVLAAKMLKSGNKNGARSAMQRRRIYLKKINQAQNMIMNLQTQMESIDTAKSTSETVKAMETGTNVVEQQMGKIDEKRVAEVMDKAAMQQDRLSMSQEILGDTSFSEGAFEDDFDISIDDELDQLQAELDMETTGDLPSIDIDDELPSVSTGKSRSSQVEDTSDLEAELEALKEEISDD